MIDKGPGKQATLKSLVVKPVVRRRWKSIRGKGSGQFMSAYPCHENMGNGRKGTDHEEGSRHLIKVIHLCHELLDADSP